MQQIKKSRYSGCVTIWCAAATTLLLSAHLPAVADTRIIGEFEYSVDDNEMREWEIGSAFLLHESTDSELELEILVGQDETLWFIQPELIYEIDFNDFNVEFSVGLEATFDGEPVESFGSIEGSLDF